MLYIWSDIQYEGYHLAPRTIYYRAFIKSMPILTESNFDPHTCFVRALNIPACSWQATLIPRPHAISVSGDRMSGGSGQIKKLKPLSPGCGLIVHITCWLTFQFLREVSIEPTSLATVASVPVRRSFSAFWPSANWSEIKKKILEARIGGVARKVSFPN